MKNQQILYNQQILFDLFASMFGQSRILTIPRTLITICNGDIKAALFISQCVYWSDRTGRNDGYFYKTHKEWEKELSLSRDEIDRIRKEYSHLIKTKIKKANGKPTLHWRVDIEDIVQAAEGLDLTPDLNTREGNSGLRETHKTDFDENDESGFVENPQNRIVGKPQNELRENHKSLTESTTESIIDDITAASGVSVDSAPFRRGLSGIKLTQEPTRASSLAQKEELTYSEPEEDHANARGTSVSQQPKWRLPKTSLAKRALRATGRKYFGTKDERSAWIAIEKSMFPLDNRGVVKYPVEWVLKLIEWAEKANYDHQMRHGRAGQKIVFPALLSAINNEARKTDFISYMLQHDTQHQELKKRLGMIEQGGGDVNFFPSEEDDLAEYEAWDKEQRRLLAEDCG